MFYLGTHTFYQSTNTLYCSKVMKNVSKQTIFFCAQYVQTLETAIWEGDIFSNIVYTLFL